LHLTLPATIEVLSSLIPCITLEGEEQWLFADMREKCSEGSHQVYSDAVMMPGLIMTGLALVGLLLFAFFNGYLRKRDQYQTAQYEKNYWFWEPLALIYKAISILTVRVSVFRLPLFQAAIFLVINIFYLVLYTAMHPVDSEPLFLLGLSSGILLFISYGGAYYFVEFPSNASVFHLILRYIFIVTNALFTVAILVMLLKARQVPQSASLPKQANLSSDPTVSRNTRVRVLAVPNNSLDMSADLPHYSPNTL
jgi:hypothetical protein